MKILNFGSCNIDYVYSMDHIVTVGETATSHQMEVFPGGKGLNQSIAAAKAGAAPSIPHKSEVLSALNELTPNKPQGDGELFLERLESYIESNLKTANIKDFASLVGYSTAHTGNLIKRVSGQTFSGLLQEKRCKTAASLLSATSLSVSEIISRVGYENESFFRAKFKEKYNENPLEYRKKRG